jgi:hypothetical protein
MRRRSSTFAWDRIVGATGPPSGPPGSVVAPWDPIDSQMTGPPSTSRAC